MTPTQSVITATELVRLHITAALSNRAAVSDIKSKGVHFGEYLAERRRIEGKEFDYKAQQALVEEFNGNGGKR